MHRIEYYFRKYLKKKRKSMYAGELFSVSIHRSVYSRALFTRNFSRTRPTQKRREEKPPERVLHPRLEL